MTRRVSITLLVALWLSLLPLLLQGQQPSPSPAPQLDSQDVVRITTNLVQIDVVVTKEGKPVTDLQAEDFEIFQDGKPQTTTNFSYVSNVPTNLSARAESKAKEKTVAPVPPAKINLYDQRRTVALVIDDLGMSWESMVRVRMQVKKFLAELSPNDLVAIIRTGGDVGSLQQFTNDQRLLQSAVEHLRWNPCSRTGLYVFAPHGRDADNASICSMYVLNDTLNSLKFILRGMRYLPGRKSMILFSDSLPIEDEESANFGRPGQIPGTNNTGAPSDPRNQTPDPGDSYYAQLQLVAELAIRGSVVIYSVDSRGLQYTGLTAADRLTSGQAGFNNEINTLMANRSRQILRGREGSDLIARQTGGFLIRNSNDFGIKQVMDDQQGYYLIGFRPGEDTFNRDFHRIKAKLKRGGLSIRTRAGFYGFTNEEARPTQLPVADLMNKALISPFSPNDVNLRLTSFFVNDPSQGPLVRSFVYLDSHDLTFREQADGLHTTYLDVRAILFGDNGRIMGQQDQNGSLRLNPADYERAMRDGLAYSFDVPLKQRGVYQFRVAVRDAVSSRIGAAGQFVEIPNLTDGRLALSGIVARIDARTDQREAPEATAPSGILRDKSIAAGPAVRRFPQGSTVKFSYAIYNGGVEGRPAQLTAQIRIFRDDKIVFTGDPAQLNFQGETDPQHLMNAVRFQIDSNMAPGNYVFQIIVTDSAKQKPRLATQWIDFEVVK